MQSALAMVKDPAVWTGTDIAARQSWKYVLKDEDIVDLKHMALSVRQQINSDPNQLLGLSKAAFDIGSFSQRLATLFSELKAGLGIALIKGLPVDEMDAIDVAIIYWGIGLHLGEATANNPEGDMLGHITDLGKTQKDANSRGYQTREAMDYHCDQSDIVGLICLRTAKSGGVSRIASSVAMYNELLRTSPAHASVLTEPLYWSKMGEYAEGEQPFYQSPVFNFIDGQCCISFGPTHIEKGHALPDTPDLTQMQRDAIRLAEEIAHKQRFDMVLEPGDMQFLNNYVVLHTRSAYKDHDDPAKKRLLWRLWLMNPALRARTGYTKNFLAGVGTQNNEHQIRLV